MKIIKCANILNFNNTTRYYYNIDDIRISDVYICDKNNVHPYHSHNKVSEVLYVIDGQILVKIKNEGKITEYKVNKNKIAIILAGEKHTVSSIKDTARVLVIKYIRKDEELLDTFLNDVEE